MKLGETSASVAASTVVRSEGQRMLMCVTGSLAAIAAEIGCKSPATVHNWRVGSKMPSVSARARMQEAFGIPQRAWSQLPNTRAETPSDAVELPELEVAANGTTQPTTLEDCMALLAVIRRDRMQPNMMPAERVKLADAEARILALRARLEEAAKLAESKYVAAHPAWLRLKRAIMKALEAHPIAARAVADAIAANMPEPS